jgi:hypothetical protein
MKKILFLMLTLAVSVLLSYGVSFIFKANIFNIHEFGFQFVMFSVVGSLMYFSLKFMSIRNTLAILFVITTIFTFVYKSTSMMQVVGNLQMLYLYLVLLFISLAFVMKLILFNEKFRMMRNLSFSITATLGYTFVHIIINLIIKTQISGSLFLSYFKNGFVIMLTLGAAFIVTEIIYSKIAGDEVMYEEEEDN